MKTVKTAPNYLKEHVKFFYSVYESDPGNTGAIHRRLPDGTLDLIFNLGATVSISRDGESFTSVPEVALAGLHRDRSFMRYAGEVVLAGAVFQPDSAHLFMNDSLRYHESSNLDASLVYGNSVSFLHEQLREARDDREKHHLLELFLMDYLKRKKSRYHQHNIPGIVQHIHSLNGHVAMTELYKNHYMSERTFRRQFTEYVGINPKLYSSIIRIKSFSRRYELERAGYSNIVHDLGYSDQSHFNKEFLKIAGTSPTAYFGQLNAIGEEFIHLI